MERGVGGRGGESERERERERDREHDILYITNDGESVGEQKREKEIYSFVRSERCILYTYEAADEEERVDLGGRRN